MNKEIEMKKMLCDRCQVNEATHINMDIVGHMAEIGDETNILLCEECIQLEKLEKEPS